MSEHDPTYEELAHRCRLAEEALAACRAAQPDPAELARQAHLKQVLLAIRNVNQLIVAETDAQRLIERACTCLTETLGYHSAWIALLDAGGQAVVQTAGAGGGAAFEVLRTQLLSGRFPRCLREALAHEAAVFVIGDEAHTCSECPLSAADDTRVGLSRRLAHGGRCYGVLTVAMPAGLQHDQEEQALFAELADDLAYALHRLEAEQQRDELTRSLQQANDVLERSPATVFVWRNEPGWPVEQVTANVGRLFGWTASEFASGAVAYSDTIHTADLARVLDEVQQAVADPTVTTFAHAPYRIVAKDARVKWVDDLTTIRRGPDGRAVAFEGILLDVTSRREAEVALQDSERRFRELFDGAPVGIFATDSAGRALAVNPAMAHILGVATPAEAIARFGDLARNLYVHPERRAEFLALLSTHGAVEGFEYEARRSDGRHIWLGMDARIVQHRPDGSFLIEGFTTDITARKLAELALRESEQRHRVYISHCPIAMFVADEHGRYVDVNDAACQLLGYTRDELLQLSIPDLDCPAGGPPALAALNALLRSGHLRSERRLQRRDGGFVEVDLEAVRIEGGRVMGFCSDITERKRVEASLRAMAEMLDVAPSSILVHDAEGRLLYANAKTFELHGYPAAEFMALNLSQIDVPASAALIADRLQRIAATGEALFEVEHYRQDGTTFPLEVFVKAVQWAGQPALLSVGTDITDRKRAEQEHERLMAAIEQMDEVVVIADAAGVIQYVNPAFERVTGYTREEAIGQGPQILQSNQHDEAFYQDLWATIGRGETWSGRIINRRRDGTFYTDEVSISPISDATGRIVSYVSVQRDITREQALEEQYRQAQKMEAIGQLTGGVAHDFNNLLQVINGYTSLAMEELDSNSPARELLAEVAQAGERAARLVEQLLLFSRRQIMRPVNLDLNAVVSDLLKMLGRVIGEHIRLDWVPGRAVGVIQADRTMVEQAVMNLCVNARDAMPEGGLLTLETAAVEVDPAFCATHQWARPGRYAMLAVTDTGCGMSKEVLGHVFEPFFTTKETGRGTGLGLATVYGIVKQHDGMVHAYSELGRGSTFRVYLPLSEPLADEAVVEATQQPVGGHETILLAEDDAMVRNLSLTLLERAGYTVLTAADGAEAVALFEAQADTIDLVILDVVMPRLGGRKAFERMRELRPHLRALFASGYSESAMDTNFVLEEGLTLLQKPYARAALLSAVREALARPAR